MVLLLLSPVVHAEYYVEFSPAPIRVDTTAGTTSPVAIDLRLGYTQPHHQFELAVMPGIKDDNLHQLSVDVPTVLSVFYHYSPLVNSSPEIHLILGMSQIKVDSSYPGTQDLSDSFYGMSYGIGFEESFKSIPQLKLSFDWIQLYRGDQIDINAASLGIHYEF